MGERVNESLNDSAMQQVFPVQARSVAHIDQGSNFEGEAMGDDDEFMEIADANDRGSFSAGPSAADSAPHPPPPAAAATKARAKAKTKPPAAKGNIASSLAAPYQP